MGDVIEFPRQQPLSEKIAAHDYGDWRSDTKIHALAELLALRDGRFDKYVKDRPRGLAGSIVDPEGNGMFAAYMMEAHDLYCELNKRGWDVAPLLKMPVDRPCDT